MLQNENSAYYELVRDTISHADIERLYTFSMNLGYNGCIIGSQHIRTNEKALGCNIPWGIALQMDMHSSEKIYQLYHTAILEGEKLGIHIWMLFAGTGAYESLSLVQNHLDSAFFLFCEPKDLSSIFLKEASKLNNLMIVVHYDENTADIYSKLRDMGLLYSVWYPYERKDLEAIMNGDLFSHLQQYSPIFTILLPNFNCLDTIHRLVHHKVIAARSEQKYHTILWELPDDNRMIDTVISGTSCSVYFDKKGNPGEWNHKPAINHYNLFQTSLRDILINTYPKKQKW